MIRLAEAHPILRGSPYQGYVYAYPHKTACRRLEPPRPLRDAWAAEPQIGDGVLERVPVGYR